MANWRTTIKTAFANYCVAAIPEIKFFQGFNNQKNNPEIEETRPEIGVYFEYSNIGDGVEYMPTQRDFQYASRVPVEVTLHIMFKVFSDQAQDLAYEYADKITCAIAGMKNTLIHGQIYKSREVEDTNHRAAYDYQISFAFFIKESVFTDTAKNLVDINPIDAISPNPKTGRRLNVDLDAEFE
jgi:hypothetical protein